MPQQDNRAQQALEVKNKRTADDAPKTYRQRRRFQAAAFGRKRKWLMAAAGRKRYALGQQKCIRVTEKNYGPTKISIWLNF
jgi:hypothetical protein